MFKSLRMKLTLVCSSITVLILLGVCLFAMRFSQTQFTAKNQSTFENLLQTISYQLQSHNIVKTSWLMQLEQDYDLIISLVDNGTPLSFRGSWLPATDRTELVSQAVQIAQDQYAFDVRIAPSSKLHLDPLFFTMKGANQDSYRVGLVRIPAMHGFFSLIFLQDLQTEYTTLLYTKLLFLLIGCSAMLLLVLFSYWFSGRALLPIEENRKKQVAFIAAASHELKSPLAVIKSSNNCLQSNPTDWTTFTTQINRECTRMARLVDDLLLLATADANTWTIEKSPVSMDTMLIDQLDLFLPLAYKKHQQLILDLPDTDIAPIQCDQERIQQVLSILVDNALFYVPPHGQITLKLASSSRHVRLLVIDNGPGIPKDAIPHLFDRFYQVDAARKDKNHYGLGLSIAKEIILLHHGTITVQDTPGGGATFEVTLPR